VKEDGGPSEEGAAAPAADDGADGAGSESSMGMAARTAGAAPGPGGGGGGQEGSDMGGVGRSMSSGGSSRRLGSRARVWCSEDGYQCKDCGMTFSNAQVGTPDTLGCLQLLL